MAMDNLDYTLFEQPTTSAQTFHPNLQQTISREDLDSELTNKFLRGEISFDDYSREWYGKDDEEDTNMEETADSFQESMKPEKSITTKRRKRTRLSAALLGLMGEANIRFVRGDREMAEKMCHEIIRQVPTAAEPYQTLAEIYENNPEKSLQFSLLAALLGSSNSEEWLRLAAISKERNDPKQQMLCYTEAIKADPHNLSIHLKRLELLKTLEESGFPVRVLKLSTVKCYHKIVTSLPVSEGEVIMSYAKQAATLYHNSNEIDKALEVMSAAYNKCPALFTLEDANLYLELLITQKEYQNCIEVFVATVGIEIEAEVQTIAVDGNIEEHTQYINCNIPENVPIDLRCKLLICLIYLGSIDLVSTLLDEFLKNSVESAGDLYVDLEEALTAVGEHTLAFKLLDPLVKNHKFNLGAVWLKHAECLYNLGKEEEAISSYNMVIRHAPQHADARRKLFKILEKQGRCDEALRILEQDPKYVVSGSLMYEHCCVLRKYKKPLKLLEVGEALLSKTFVRFRHQGELKIARRVRGGVDLVHNFRLTRGENPYNESDLQFDEEEVFRLSAADEWELLKELLAIAHEHKKYFIMERLTFGALMSKNLNPYRHDLDFYCLQACLLNKDFNSALSIIRDLALRFPDLPMVWNILNLINQYHDDINYNKFLVRFFQKSPNDLMDYFLGFITLMSGRYIESLKYFLQRFEQRNEAFTALLIGITILIMASQRSASNHHDYILQAISYLFTYKDLRKVDQECYYNIGRAYQMLNINNLAIEYYEKALQCPQVIECNQHGILDLKKETAFNLYLLYKDNSPNIAIMYLQKYLVI